MWGGLEIPASLNSVFTLASVGGWSSWETIQKELQEKKKKAKKGKKKKALFLRKKKCYLPSCSSYRSSHLSHDPWDKASFLLFLLPSSSSVFAAAPLLQRPCSWAVGAWGGAFQFPPPPHHLTCSLCLPRPAPEHSEPGQPLVFYPFSVDCVKFIWGHTPLRFSSLIPSYSLILYSSREKRKFSQVNFPDQLHVNK